jgi:hypothetical protein
MSMSEAAHIKENVTDCISLMITRAQSLSENLKRAEFVERNMVRDLLGEIIVIGYCTMYMSEMTSSGLQEIIENTLAYFKTGLYDTDKTTGNVHFINHSYYVRSWVYTPDTHNDAGEWFYIHSFNNIHDADDCINMLKEIESELKKIN